MEQAADQRVEQARPEFEINTKIDLASAVGEIGEAPEIAHPTERSLGGLDHDAVRPLHFDARAECLADHLESDHQIRVDDIIVARGDPRCKTPRQEFGIALDRRDQFEKLVGGIGHDSAIFVDRHRVQRPAPWADLFRAARNFSKSASAWYEDRVSGVAETM